jgi:hypothetical protein
MNNKAQYENGAVDTEKSAATPKTSESNKDTSPSSSGPRSGGGRYLPPHLRSRVLSSNDNGNSSRGDEDGPSSRESGDFEKKPEKTYSPKPSKWKEEPYEDEYDRPPRKDYSASPSVGRSGDGYVPSPRTPRVNKWKEPAYGPDGLMPRDVRTERELFTANESSAGLNFEKYNDIPVQAFGDDVPEPIQLFEDLNLGPVITHNINLCQYKTPTPVQKYALPIILEGRDMMACAQTGSGKTGAFLFPIIAKLLRVAQTPGSGMVSKASPECLILAPTRELALQIHNEARKVSSRF